MKFPVCKHMVNMDDAALLFRRIIPVAVICAVTLTAGLCLLTDTAMAADDQEQNENGWVRLADGTRIQSGPVERPKFGLGYNPPEDIDRILEEKLKVYPVTKDDLPAYIDWRTLGGVTPVKSQGGCGSCWAFAAAAELESYILINYGKSLDISEQQIMDCNPWGAGCDGGWAGSAYYIFTHYGAVLERCVPYTAMDGFPCTQGDYIPFGFITDYHSVAGIEDQMKAALLNGPLCTSVDANDPWFEDYTAGCYDNPGGSTNHLVLIVGYDDRLCDGQGAWIIKNSHGTDWGMGGYGYFKYGSGSIPTNLTQIDYSPPPVAVNITGPGATPIMGEATAEISWFTTGPAVSNVDIWFSLNSGCHDILLASDTPNDGSFMWDVPNTATEDGSLVIFPSTGTDDGFGFSVGEVTILGHKIRYVSEAGSNTPPFETPATAAHDIADAVLACTGYDSVMVAGGDYLETITINSTVRIFGGYSPDFNSRDTDTYTTNVRGVTSAVRINEGAGDYCWIDGITFYQCQGGIFADPVSGRHGAAIFSRDANPTIRNCVFQDNHAAVGTDVGYGGAILALGGAPVIEDCVFTNNIASRGGAVALIDVNGGVLQNNVFDGNQCSSIENSFLGAGIYAQNSEFTLENVDLLNNGNCYDGGGIYADASTITGIDVDIVAGAAQHAGGGLYANNSDIDLRCGQVTGSNATTSSGGGVSATGGQFVMHNIMISGNQSGSMGGGMNLTDVVSGTIENCLITDNTGMACGGLFLSTDGVFYLRNTSITENSGFGVFAIGENIIGEYDNFWNNESGDFNGSLVPQYGIFAAPLYVDATGGDYGLAKFSPLIDRGDPDAACNDPDGSRSDVGYLGGPTAAFIAPNAVSAAMVTELGGGEYRLNWSANSADDIAYYVVFRDTAEVFEASADKVIAEVPHPTTMLVDTPPGECYYLVCAVDEAGHCGGYSNRLYTDQIIPVGNPDLPAHLAIASVAPNPFNPLTTIAYSVPRSGNVSVRVYDLAGRLVQNLVSGQVEAGSHSVKWNGTDRKGSRMAAGVYFVRVDDGLNLATRKVVLAK